ncbi:MAG: hypothetical protein HRU38_07460 [Saccharospirillaceae bacterium]|nr:hypothetical protein [Pseudomonadales bacterium]NRB78489.1 hypothetical protein [Saccharospirillaceae bacterium]
MSEDLEKLKEEELNKNKQSKPSLLQQLSSRITFGIGGVIGAFVAMYLQHPMAVGVLFGGASALTLTTMFSPNKSYKERIILGGAMLLFLVVAIIAYVNY